MSNEMFRLMNLYERSLESKTNLDDHCTYCNVKFETGSYGEILCPRCCAVVSYGFIVDQYDGCRKQVNSYRWTRSKYFNIKLMHVLGQEQICVPHELIDLLKTTLKHQKLESNVRNICCLLGKFKKIKYRKNIAQILNNLNIVMYPRIAHCKKAELLKTFQSFDRFCKLTYKSKVSNMNFVLKQVLAFHGFKPEILYEPIAKKQNCTITYRKYLVYWNAWKNSTTNII